MLSCLVGQRFLRGRVIVGPDDLVQEAFPAEDRVQHHLGVVDFPVIQMQVQGAVVCQQSPGLHELWFQERPVIAEGVVVAMEGALDGVVRTALEADAVAVAVRIADHTGFLAALDPARVEGRVHVNECEGAVRQRWEEFRVVRVHHQVAAVRRPNRFSH